MATSRYSFPRQLSVICSAPHAESAGDRAAATRDETVTHHLGEITLLAAHGLGAVLETPPPSPTSGPGATSPGGRRAVTTLLDVRARHRGPTPLMVHATVRPDLSRERREGAPEDERSWRARLLAQVYAGADIVSGRAVTTVAAAVAVALASRAAEADCVIWLALGPDGHLADGEPPHEAVRSIDLATRGSVIGYGLELAAGSPPPVWDAGPRWSAAWLDRIGGVRFIARPGSGSAEELADALVRVAVEFPCVDTFGSADDSSPDDVVALVERLTD
ncbi:MAG: hypothetical protein S0880_33835 [Actinomycetota bacterium]|nr:hypothetical protein [Actinomycetota bacterium]